MATEAPVAGIRAVTDSVVLAVVTVEDTAGAMEAASVEATAAVDPHTNQHGSHREHYI